MDSYFWSYQATQLPSLMISISLDYLYARDLGWTSVEEKIPKRRIMKSAKE